MGERAEQNAISSKKKAELGSFPNTSPVTGDTPRTFVACRIVLIVKYSLGPPISASTTS
jgi:hypothetical protein